MIGSLLSVLQGNQTSLNTMQTKFYENHAAGSGGAIFATQTDFNDYGSDFFGNHVVISGGAVSMEVYFYLRSISKHCCHVWSILLSPLLES